MRTHLKQGEPSQARTSGPVLEIRGAVKRFGVRTALDGMDLTLSAGEVFALVGPNGAGKTTTINLILGFLKTEAGSVHVCGIDAGTDPVGARGQVAYIPEQVALYPGLSGVENLRAFFEPRILAQAMNPVPVCAECPARLNFDAYDAVPAFRPSIPRAVAEYQALAALGCLLAGALVLTALTYRRLAAWPS